VWGTSYDVRKLKSEACKGLSFPKISGEKTEPDMMKHVTSGLGP
jgi:hypothetical protein